MTSLLTGLLTGTAFGVLLYKVGATRYSRIMGMLTLRDTKIMKFAFTTIAVTSMLYGLASLAGVATDWNLETRVMPYMGGAHILGGVLFGGAMGFTGLCPGTCAAKAGGRAGEKRFVLAAALIGLVLGVVIYAWVKEPLTDAGVIAARPRMLTLHGYLGLPYGVVAMVFGAVIMAIVLVVDRFTPEKRYELAKERRSLLDWIRGEWSFLASGTVAGLLIVAATAQGGYLGFSGSLLALVGAGANLIGVKMAMVPVINDDIIWRAGLIVGAVLGGFVSSVVSIHARGFAGIQKKKTLDVKAIFTALSGTTMMALGAMIGGGCTTGAFLAAWPTLSVGSFAMALTFFATSMAVSNLRLWVVHSLDMSVAQQVGERVYD
jgi:hypothetical protein